MQDKPKSTDNPLQEFENLFAQVKAELNFLRLPYFATRKDAQQGFLELIETVERDGVKRRIEWRVVPDPRLGLPGAIERNVMFIIFKRADEARPGLNAPIPEWIDIGSIYGICVELGLESNGQNRVRIKQALRKLGSTNCISMGAFYDKANKKYVESSDVFTFLQSWRLKGELHNRVIWETNAVSIHPWVRQNLDAFYVKALDWSLLRSLESEIAALLYPHLSCVFHGLKKDQEHIELGYNWLAQRLGISICKDLREAKKQLKPAHTELIAKGYLSNVKWVNDKIKYFPGLRASVEIAHQKKRKRTASSKSPHFFKQLVIPTLEPLKQEVDERATEIARQAARLQLGKPLKPDRLLELNIDVQEIHEYIGKLGNASNT